MTWEFQDIFSSVICSGSVQSNIETDNKLTFNTRLWRANLKLRNAAFQSRETGEDCQPMGGEQPRIRRCDWLLPWQQTSSAQQQAVNWQHCTARRCGHQHFFRVVQYNYFYISKIFLLKENIGKLQQKLSPQKSLRTPRVCEDARKIFVALWLKNIWRALVGSIVRAWQSRAAWLLATSPLPPWPSGITATFGPGRARHTTGVHHHQLPFYFLPADSDSKYLPAVKTSTNPRWRSLQKTHKVNVDIRLFTFCVRVCGCRFLRK